MTTDVVASIAQALSETEPEPIAQIERIIERCGLDQAQAWLQQTQEIEANGGEMLPDNSRRRTLGGVYFKPVRKTVSFKDKVYIFPQYRKRAQPAPWAAAATPPPPPVSWDAREPFVKAATGGKASTVLITIIGRPGKAVERPGFALLLLKRSGALPPLPKGVPTPPQGDTDYIVYVGEKQWRKVKESLKQPEDVLICEGTPILDPKFNGITVFATNVTTKLLQQAMRAAKQT